MIFLIQYGFTRRTVLRYHKGNQKTQMKTKDKTIDKREKTDNV